MARRDMDIVEELRGSLRIDKYALDDEVVQQAEMYHEVADQAVLAESRKDEAENLVKQLFAELDIRIRKAALKNDEKLTEREIASRIARDRNYVKAVKKALEARKVYKRLDALQTSFRQRSYMVRDLVELHIAGYYQSQSQGGSKRRHTDNEAEDIKRKLSEKRKRARITERRGSRARSRIKKNPNAD